MVLIGLHSFFLGFRIWSRTFLSYQDFYEFRFKVENCGFIRFVYREDSFNDESISFVGETVLLKCEVNCDPKPVYRWTSDSKNFQGTF